jgi:hypothetical protein
MIKSLSPSDHHASTPSLVAAGDFDARTLTVFPRL